MSFSRPQDGFNFSAISDNYYDSCLYDPGNSYFAIAESFRRFLHFDCIVTLILQLLIILSVLFKIYGFGMQQPLRIFYNKVRFGLIKMLSLFSFAAGFCAICNLWFDIQPACLKWDQTQIYTFSRSWRTPNIDNIVTLILSLSFFSMKMNWFTGILVSMFIIVDCFSSLKIGAVTINGLIITEFLGVWIFCLFEFLPTIAIPLLNLIIIICNIVLFVPKSGLYQAKINTAMDSLHLALRGPFVIIISQILLLGHAKNQDDFDWFDSDGFSLSNQDSDDIFKAEIPRMQTKIRTHDFGEILKRDLYYSSIGFLAFLIGNYYIGYFYNYKFFT